MPSLIHRLPFAQFFLAPLAARPRRERAPARSEEVAPPVQLTSPSPSLDELRGNAMRRLYPKLYSWWASRWEWGVALQSYAYLAEATSAEDLEQRVRRIERQRHFRA